MGKGMYSERKALCSLSQNKRAFTCIPRARTHPHSGIALTQSLAKPREQTRGWLCVWFNFAKGILRTDVYWRQVLLTYLLLLLQFSQLTNAFVRFRNCYRFGTWGKGTPCHSSSCSSIVHRNSRFHLIMGIVRIYVMTLFRIHLHHEPPRDDL